jgi:hypothetical protein
MTRRRRGWLIGAVLLAVVVATFVTLYVMARRLAANFEPMVRYQAVEYLRTRFHCDVRLKTLHVHLPKLSTLALLFRHEKGARIRVDGEGLSMRLATAPADAPPLFTMRRFGFAFDLNALRAAQKTVDSVTIDGLEIDVPPRQNRPSLRSSGVPPGQPAANPNVIIKDVKILNASLVLLPRDTTRKPMQFQIADLRLTSVGVDSPMRYDATLAIPKPPGQVRSQGTFGPWEADDPGSTQLAGKYTFSNADLGIFNGIAGILNSTGRFDGTLGAVHATGEARVPDFRLKMTGHAVSLWTRFDCLVDGTNGNTVLQPVHARLGSTAFTTTGAVIKHEDQPNRSIDLKVNMPDGDIRDLLRLATKQPPFMEGRLNLNSTVSIPPLTAKVKQKLVLDGTFELSDAHFLGSHIQQQLDQLSRRGQGQPTNQSIGDVLSNMGGSFRLDNQVMTLRALSFAVPGADVDLTGAYDMDRDSIDFHGALKLRAKVSETMTGWKRWALKPVDPFFAKNGAGTYLRIRVDGSSKQPHFGLDR